MSNSTFETLPIKDTVTPESIVGDYARQSATADFNSSVATYLGLDPEIVKQLEFERDSLKYKAKNFILRDTILLTLFQVEYMNTLSELNNPQQ